MYLNNLMSLAELRREPVPDKDVVILPGGLYPWCDIPMVVTRQNWDSVYVECRAKEPDVEPVFATILAGTNKEFLRAFACTETVSECYGRLRSLLSEQEAAVDEASQVVQGVTEGPEEQGLEPEPEPVPAAEEPELGQEPGVESGLGPESTVDIPATPEVEERSELPMTPEVDESVPMTLEQMLASASGNTSASDPSSVEQSAAPIAPEVQEEVVPSVAPEVGAPSGEMEFVELEPDVGSEEEPPTPDSELDLMMQFRRSMGTQEEPEPVVVPTGESFDWGSLAASPETSATGGGDLAIPNPFLGPVAEEEETLSPEQMMGAMLGMAEGSDEPTGVTGSTPSLEEMPPTPVVEEPALTPSAEEMPLTPEMGETAPIVEPEPGPEPEVYSMEAMLAHAAQIEEPTTVTPEQEAEMNALSEIMDASEESTPEDAAKTEIAAIITETMRTGEVTFTGHESEYIAPCVKLFASMYNDFKVTFMNVPLSRILAGNQVTEAELAAELSRVTGRDIGSAGLEASEKFMQLYVNCYIIALEKMGNNLQDDALAIAQTFAKLIYEE